MCVVGSQGGLSDPAILWPLRHSQSECPSRVIPSVFTSGFSGGQSLWVIINKVITSWY